jgi:transmembrane sensor
MDDQLNQIISNYLKGEITPEEQKILAGWLEEKPENKYRFDQFCDIWFSTSSGLRSRLNFDSLEALKKVNRKIGLSEENQKYKKTIQLTSLQAILRIAAIVLITFGASYLAFLLFNSTRNIVPSNAVTEISAPIGSKSKVTLPDGTKIWLNAGSTIRYSNDFNKINREIKLEGEAYFDVTKNKHMPFIVHTLSNINIRVLGTAFNLKAYPREGSVETTLVRGSLIVERQDNNQLQKTTLAPNQRATYIKTEGKVFLSEVDKQSIVKETPQRLEQIKGKVLFAPKVETEIFTSWKDNKLIFRNEGFESLAIKLERWYGVKINVEGEEINNYHFNGAIENETINDVFKYISYTLPIKYTIQHNVVTVSKDTRTK